MKFLLCLLLLLAPATVRAGITVDEEVLGKLLGGWTEEDGQAAAYAISGSRYRTWKPHITPTLDGGIYLSMRIDHLRGRFASDDHASLELTYTGDGEIATARSTIALQGRKVTSDLIRGGSQAGTSLLGVDRAVKVGTDLIANLSAKLLRENISEPGRVGFPAALRHNYNLLTLSIRSGKSTAKPEAEDTPAPVAVPVPPEKEQETEDPADPAPQPDEAAPDRPPELEVTESDPSKKGSIVVSEDL